SRRFVHSSRLQSAANNNPVLRKVETSEGVKLLQQALIDLGFAMPISTQKTGKPDGAYGDETAATVSQFQSLYELQADGIAGRDTPPRLDPVSRDQEDGNTVVCTLPERACPNGGGSPYPTVGFGTKGGPVGKPVVTGFEADIELAEKWR